MTIVEKPYFIELTADEGKTIHKIGTDIYEAFWIIPKTLDIETNFEEVLLSEVPPPIDPY